MLSQTNLDLGLGMSTNAIRPELGGQIFGTGPRPRSVPRPRSAFLEKCCLKSAFLEKCCLGRQHADFHQPRPGPRRVRKHDVAQIGTPNCYHRAEA